MPLSLSSTMRCASALSTREDAAAALQQICHTVREQVGGSIDLAVLFVSQAYGDADQVAAQACELLGTDNVVGCTAESVVGQGREIEHEPAMSLWVAHWPGVETAAFHLQFERTREGGVIQGWPDHLAGEWPEETFLLLLGEPFSFPADLLLDRLNEDRPGVPVIGGMASGGAEPGENRLFLGRQALAEGCVAVLVSGPLRLRTVVSQGCRPIGRHFVVTKAERNIIYELGGKPALIQLKEIFDKLPTREQVLVHKALHVGRVVSEYQENFNQGDFLVRNVVGIDPSAGAVALGDYFRTGQTIQFHIRDQDAADAELKQMLARLRDQSHGAAGALVFTCNGRGTRMFGKPHHDAEAVERALGQIPVAGFFAQGEIGPIGRQNFMHGFTASVAVIEPKE